MLHPQGIIHTKQKPPTNGTPFNTVNVSGVHNFTNPDRLRDSPTPLFTYLAGVLERLGYPDPRTRAAGKSLALILGFGHLSLMQCRARKTMA